MTLMEELEAVGPWYHRVELPTGDVTPGTRDQSLVFALFESHLPADLSGTTVLDLGANAGGLALEFAKRGARVVAVERIRQFLVQAEIVFREHSLLGQIEFVEGDVYGIDLSRRFDIVCYVGLSYHLRYPQLALDMLTRVVDGYLLTSTQSIKGDNLTMANRARRVENRGPGELHGWEPTENLFLEMLAHAGFRHPKLVSTRPHPGELAPDRICGNRSYFFAEAAESPRLLPYVDGEFWGKPEHAPR